MLENLRAKFRVSQEVPEISGARLAPVLEREIERYQQPGHPGLRMAAPRFPPELELKFENDTREVRMRDLRIAMILGAILFFATSLMDPVLVPDLGWDAFWLRTLAVPFMLFDLCVGTTLRAPAREWLLTITAFVVVTVLAAIPAASSSPLAPFAFANAILAVAYANTTVVLRFTKASAFSVYWCRGHFRVCGAAGRHWEPLGMGHRVASHPCGVVQSFCQLQHRSGVGGSTDLLGTREAMRLKAVAADRETFKVLSSIDELTQLANRGSFNRKCETAFADPANRGLSATLLMIDVDHFKRYNDHYGHLAGDACLRAVAQRISETVRNETDLVARYGGEEFVVLLRDIAPAQAEKLAVRICDAVGALRLEHANRDDGLGHVTISIGIAATDIRVGSSLEALMRVADRGLYDAKRKGRNRVEPALVSAA